MPGEHSGVSEGATVQVTPATPSNPNGPNAQPNTPQEGTPAVKTPTLNPLQKIAGALLSLVLLASLACGVANQAPAHNESAGIDDSTASVQSVERPSFVPASVPFISTGNPADEPTHYGIVLTLAKCAGEVAVCTPGQAYEVHQDYDNLLTTAGAGALWSGLSTAGLATPFNTTNAALGVGDGTTAAAVTDTDLGAAAGSTITTSGLSACTNATPIVCTNGSGNWSATPAVGSVVVVAGVNGNTNANGTWEVSASTSTTVTLLNSSGNAAFTTSGSATVKPINRYLQQANASGSAVVSGNQITYVATFGTSNANFAWQEWSLATGAAATNKQAAAPPTLFNHKIVSLGTKTGSASWTLTAVLSLS